VQTISLQVPDSLLPQAGGSQEQLSEQAQVLLAVKYFELGLLNFGQAAAMCAMERADFLSLAKRHGVPVGDWQGL
jgi:predicted HTH domain antitoxin